jgi:catalase
MAIKFHLPDGSETDMVTNSLKFFLVSSGADFRDLFLAIAVSPPDAPKPTKLEQFVATHPAVAAASATVATPDSLFLVDELPQRLKQRPVTFHLAVQLAAPSDSTKDPTQPWPNDRKVVDLGILTINKRSPTVPWRRSHCYTCRASSPTESSPLTIR